MSDGQSWDICPVCYWQDDPVQNADEDLNGGANVVSLREARRNYVVLGVSELNFRGHVREPTVDELPGSYRTLALVELPDAQTLTACLARFGDRAIRVGSTGSQFHAATLGERAFGVVSERHGVAPAAAVVGSLVMIGHDKTVTVVARSSTLVAVELPSLFHELLTVEDGVIAVHETGAMRVKADASIAWSVDVANVITGFELVGDSLQLQSLEGAFVHLDIATGAARAMPF